MSWVMVGIAAVNMTMAGVKAVSAHRSKKEQDELAAAEKIKTDKLMTQYGEMDTSNPFENLTNTFDGVQNQFSGLENTMEDLTVNQKQAQFQAQQNQQAQANILSSLRGAAGGSGIAALAQTMAQQGQLSAQKASASIGTQEAMNQRMLAQEAGRLQTAEARGASNLDQLRAQQGYNIQVQRGRGVRDTQRMETDKISTQLAMSQGIQQAHNENADMYQQQTMDNIQQAANSAVTLAGGIYGGVTGGN
jgi:hypothetical protein